MNTKDERCTGNTFRPTTPFDLKSALAGNPVVLRNGLKAYVRHHETGFKATYPLIGYSIHDEGEVGFPESWMEGGHCYWDKEEYGYDIVGMWVEPLVFEHWDLLSEDIKYLAKDVNGRWNGYFRKPTRDTIEWIVQPYAGYYPLKALHPKLFPDCEWENSLIERPENG